MSIYDPRHVVIGMIFAAAFAIYGLVSGDTQPVVIGTGAFVVGGALVGFAAYTNQF